MKETELYEPVKSLLTELGFEVYAEVNDMDVMAVKDEQILAVELKTSFNLKLILQAITRQKIAESVYVAIPRPKYKQRFSKSFKEKELLLRRLELGLILVATDVKVPYAQIVFDPKPYDLNRSRKLGKKRQSTALKEVSERHGDYNIGGTKGKLVTAYREKALIIVSLLKNNGEMKVKDIRALTGNDKVQAFLANNHYGWFERVGRGVYNLTPEGHQAYDTYLHVIKSLI